MPTIGIEVAHDIATTGPTLLNELTDRLKRSTPREATVVTVKFSKYELQDLAFRAINLESLGEKIVRLPAELNRDGHGLAGLGIEDVLAVLVLNAALATRNLSTEESARVRFWKRFESDGSMFCVTVVLPEVARIPAQHIVRRSG
jgi:hypothetical protein